LENGKLDIGKNGERGEMERGKLGNGKSVNRICRIN
jgi:hypothetical protein